MLPEHVEEKQSLGETINSIASAMLRLGPGDLARLRRMKTDGPGELVFWGLAVRHHLRTDVKGMALVRILALLAPKGDLENRKPFHETKQSLGEALAKTGFSETRLARFLEQPFDRRAEALERMARWLSAKGATPVNCIDIACLLFSNDVKHARKLADTYYRGFDWAASHQAKESAA
jgi:hypothetical protein